MKDTLTIKVEEELPPGSQCRAAAGRGSAGVPDGAVIWTSLFSFVTGHAWLFRDGTSC